MIFLMILLVYPVVLDTTVCIDSWWLCYGAHDTVKLCGIGVVALLGNMRDVTLKEA